jgi:outer membrane protein assembly factor BamB
MRWLALVALAAGGFAVTKLPRPTFPAPLASARAATHMHVVSSRYRSPSTGSYRAWSTGPASFRGAALQRVILGMPVFRLYGEDGSSARYLLAFDAKGRYRYGFDFANYVWPPRIRPGNREFVYEEIVWAREDKGVLYVENAHDTYASSSYGRNGYVTAIDLKRKRALWRSPALVANAKSFAVTPHYVVAGYGFTKEPDYLYLLDRRTGRVVERLKLPTAPEQITRQGNRLHVRTYDHDLVVQLANV